VRVGDGLDREPAPHDEPLRVAPDVGGS
jgi:hypothetical protein